MLSESKIDRSVRSETDAWLKMTSENVFIFLLPTSFSTASNKYLSVATDPNIVFRMEILE